MPTTQPQTTKTATKTATRVARPPRARKPAKAPSPTLAHVHETMDSVAVVELTPPHPPRTETPEYAKAHKFLINVKNSPCVVCGVTKRTIKNPAKNPFNAKQLESHHYPVERSLIDAVDWRKVHADYPSVYDQASLLRWVDSPENLIILCDYHHRNPEAGIHHLVTQDWAIQKYLLTGYKVAATQKDAAQVEAADEALMQSSGVEAAVAQEVAQEVAQTAESSQSAQTGGA